MRKYFNKLSEIEGSFSDKIHELELEMAEETGVEDICFFWVDNSIVGIGNDSRTMKLIHREV